LPRGTVLDEIAAERGLTPEQVALAWVLRREEVLAIPKAGTVEHVRANRAAQDLLLDDAALARLDVAFEPPRAKRALEML
jgi:diketogulonate reductase-like aldo/keto reductase